MLLEEQLTYNAFYSSAAAGVKRAGQRLTVTNRNIARLGLFLSKFGSPTANITFEIRLWSDKSLITSQLWGSASGLSTSAVFREVTFATPSGGLNGSYFIGISWPYAGSAGIQIHRNSSSVKASEWAAYYTVGGGWAGASESGLDTAYIYTYEEATDVPIVQIRAMSAVASTTAIGNGYILNLGSSDVTAHGIAYGTVDAADRPNIVDDSSTDEGTGAVGNFTSNIASLTNLTIYYARAYATNSQGTSYGNRISFITGGPSLVTTGTPGSIAVKATMIQLFDASGVKRYVEGTPV